MKKFFIPFVFSVCSCVAGYGQVSSEKYIAFTIPDSLLKGADAVMREDYMKFKVKDIDNAVLEVHSIVTILNESASEYLSFAETSDKFSHLDDAEIKVYNALGKKLNTYSKKEMQNFAYGDGLVEDGKTTFFRVTAATYPITIEKTYSIKFTGLLNYPSNYIQSPDVAVEHFNYTVEVPNDLGLRYKIINGKLEPSKENTGKSTIYTWEQNNLKAKAREKYSGPAGRYFPRILLGPNKFKMAGYEGDMSSWKNFGVWSYDLIGKGNMMTGKSKEVIKNLIKDAKTDNEKARIIYSYMQKNMRYVSIQLGIGGWKPFDANFVQEKKYGDCKALSNYMQSALNVAGIKSYYALVNAGTNAIPAMEDFPSNQFNHVILCIPSAKDSLWLECTSTTTDFGELGDFTENRKALLITENGGILVSTPGSRSKDNIFSCTSNVQLFEDGSGKVASSITSSGEFKQEQVHYLNQQSFDDQKEYIIQHLEWKHPDEVSIKCGDRFQTPYVTSTTMNYAQLYSFKAGSKLFLPQRFYPLFSEKINDNLKRTQDYYFDFPYVKNDTTIFVLPEGYTAENLPSDKNISRSFAKYQRKYTWDETTKKLTVIASIEILQHHILAADYTTLMLFKKEVDSDLEQKLVIKKS